MKKKGVEKVNWYLDIRKLAIFSILTFGLYYFYWFYRNWVQINIIKKEHHRPLLRTLGLLVPLLNLYLVYTQFEEIKEISVEIDYKLSFSPLLLTFVYMVLLSLWKLPDFDYYSYLGALSFLPLIPVQKGLNAYWKGGKSEKIMFSVKEVILLIVFGFIFLLSLL